MNKYDRHRLCLKCGLKGSADTWREARAMTLLVGLIEVPELIERVCNNCGFEWCEKPLDSQDKTT